MFFDQSNTLAGGEDTFDGLGNIETMDGIDWNNIINQAFGVGSQAISAFSGRNTGTQIGYNPASQSVFAIQQSGGSRNFDDGPVYYTGATSQQTQAYGPQGVAGTVGSGVDGIFNWLMANPLITFGGIAGLYLLFREPPRRR